MAGNDPSASIMPYEVEFVRPSFGSSNNALHDNIKFICGKCGTITFFAWYKFHKGRNCGLYCDPCKEKEDLLLNGRG